MRDGEGISFGQNEAIGVASLGTRRRSGMVSSGSDTRMTMIAHRKTVAQDSYRAAVALDAAGRSSQAFTAYLHAARLGLPEAENAIGVCYRDGYGTQKNRTLAVHWFHLAAKKDDPEANLNLGYAYEHGEGVKCDINRAIKLYKVAARLGEYRAVYNLGVLTFRGNGLQRDLRAAFTLFRTAARKGHRASCFMVGYCYWQGLGVRKNAHEAAKWIHRAASLGHAAAEGLLGTFYHDGIGTRRSLAKARQWYASGARHHDDWAKAGLVMVREEARRRYRLSKKAEIRALSPHEQHAASMLRTSYGPERP